MRPFFSKEIFDLLWGLKPRPWAGTATAHPWCDGHCISISACGVWEVRAGVQVFKREFHIHIHLDYVRVEYYLVYIKKKKKECNYIQRKKKNSKRIS